MNTVAAELTERDLERAEIDAVFVGEDSLSVDLKDGRTIVTPLLWYPRLNAATEAEQQRFKILRNVIYWPEIDEEISVRGMLLGRMSGESQQSLQRWMAQRQPVAIENGIAH